MNTLTISQIFLNFSFYKENYLSIVHDPAQYQILVEGAYIDVWPLGHQDLCLGDLLQLWLGDKWIINLQKEPLINTVLREKTKSLPEFDQYIYAVQGNLLTGKNTAHVWSSHNGQSAKLTVDSLFQYYCVFKSLTRPEICKNNLKSALNQAI